ncbi:MAG TPA: geranylgeranyl reductase family protein [Acidimicrobiales bacterium]|nr:geranylgeranyl reductase family protein [Acidimicrobiales bacterium]
MVAADVAVVGGGPAGAAAAITLARGGRDVVLVDRARFPRDKCCGDGLTTGALRRLEELGLRPSTVASWKPVDDVWVRSPSGRTTAFPFPAGQGTFAAVARRVDLDAALLNVARAAGVKVFDGHGLRGARWEPGADVVELDVDGIGTVAARYAVGADGMWSPLRKALGPADEAGYLGEWHAFRQYFRGVSEAAASQLWVWFEPDLLPGYAWSFPLGSGRANVGFGIQRAAGAPTRSMGEQWRELLERPHLRAVLGEGAEPEAPHKAWPIPARLERTSVAGAGGRVLFAGDAARGTDPMTGEGIGQALEMGMLAGRSILAAGARDPGGAAAIYERAVRSGLGVDNRLAGLLSRHGIAHRKGVRSALWLAGTSAWTRRNFARWLFEDYPRALVFTPHRWRRGTLSQSGAFSSGTPLPAHLTAQRRPG